MVESPAKTLTAFFVEPGDIRHDLEFVILDLGPVQPGTRIVASDPDEKGSYLEIITDKGQGIWQAEWHDKTGESPHNGKFFRVILIPPVEYQDELPVRRQFKVELIGDHELPSPWSA